MPNRAALDVKKRNHQQVRKLDKRTHPKILERFDSCAGSHVFQPGIFEDLADVACEQVALPELTLIWCCVNSIQMSCRFGLQWAEYFKCIS